MAAALAAAGSLLLVRRRRSATRRAPGRIVTLGDRTSVDATGAVRSVQRAELLMDERALGEIWDAAHLERLARTYWRFLTRVTLGLVRVRYAERERSVVLIARPLRLLVFSAPEYEMGPGRGLVRWRITRGLLVSRRGRDGRGHLQIEVTRHAADEPGLALLHVEVEVANFYPSIASRLSRGVYEATQSRVHVLVTYGFLRSLARLDLAASRVGRFSAA